MEALKVIGKGLVTGVIIAIIIGPLVLDAAVTTFCQKVKKLWKQV